MRILQLIFLDLLLVSTLILGEKLSKEGILPQREKETHFPAMPNMPNMFILVSGIPNLDIQGVPTSFGQLYRLVLGQFRPILGQYLIIFDSI